MSRPVTRRYPFEPLEQLVTVHVGPCVSSGQLVFGSANLLAEHLGVSSRSVFRWRREGMSMDQADVYATRFGLHPFEVWPEMLEDLLAESRAAAEEQRRRRAAAARESARLRRKRKRKRDWYQRNRDHVLRYRRAYYETNRDRELSRQRAYREKARAA